MAGIQWFIRRTETYDIRDGLFIAEPVFHVNTQQLGIMDDIFIGWWPLIDPETTDYTIPANYNLSGKNGGKPTMQLNWNTASELRFVHMHPTYPYWEKFPRDETPVPVVTIKADSTRISKAAPDEKLNNGAANSLEDFGIPLEMVTTDITIDSKTDTIKQRGGNGFLWVQYPDENLKVTVANVGSVDNSGAIKNKGNQRQTWHVQGKSGIGFKVPAANNVSSSIGRGIGYRSWVHTPDANKRKLTFSMVVNDHFNPGVKFSTRIGYPGNWQMFESSMSAEGQRHFVFHFDPSKVKAANKDKPLCIDWFYDWHHEYATFVLGKELNLSLSALTLHEGWWDAEMLNPAFLSMQQDRDSARLYGFTEVKEYAYGPVGSVIFDRPMLRGDYRLALTTSVPMQVTEKSRYGFSYQADIDADQEWSFSYFAKIVGDLADVA